MPISPSAKTVYNVLRKASSGPVSHAQLKDVCEFSSRSVSQRAMETLMRHDLLRKDITHGCNTWTLKPVRWSDQKSFRGSLSINVRAASDGLGTVPDEYEHRQLFLAFENEPTVAAVYRALRGEIGNEITKQDLWRGLGMTPASFAQALKRLEASRLIDQRPDAEAIVVYVVATDLTGPVAAGRLREWLRHEAAPETLMSEAKLQMLVDAKGALPIKIVQFFEALMNARGRSSHGLGSRGGKDVNMRVARNLARKHRFIDLRGPLVFFVFDWQGENVERWGRTLQTFAKNLSIINEEYEVQIGTERDYVRTMMIRHGLDEDFPIPDKWEPKKREYKMTEAQLKILDERRA
ncbi:MAG: hypothetical protein AB7J35_21280 [Dehalococcoidia bacterium]